MIGSWKININTNGMPQKVASAMADLKIIGAEYTPIAYLGSQQVNGINHAVLAEQLVITGKDTKNIVIIKFNEKTDEKLALVGIDTVIESGGELGGIKVDAQTNIPTEVKETFDICFEGYVGANIVPFAYLGSQMTKGVDYIVAAEVKPIAVDPKANFVVFVVNGLTKTVKSFEPLANHTNTNSLGYAFTW